MHLEPALDLRPQRLDAVESARVGRIEERLDLLRVQVDLGLVGSQVIHHQVDHLARLGQVVEDLAEEVLHRLTVALFVAGEQRLLHPSADGAEEGHGDPLLGDEGVLTISNWCPASSGPHPRVDLRLIKVHDVDLLIQIAFQLHRELPPRIIEGSLIISQLLNVGVLHTAISDPMLLQQVSQLAFLDDLAGFLLDLLAPLR